VKHGKKVNMIGRRRKQGVRLMKFEIGKKYRIFIPGDHKKRR